jgi:hypothetical protein
VKAIQILRSALLVLMLSACDYSKGVQQAQVEISNQNYVTRVQYDALYAEATKQILALNRLTENQKADITNFQKQNNLLTLKNTEASKEINSLNWLLSEKNDADRRVLALWDEDNWFWVHECENSWAEKFGFSLCQFTDDQYKRAELMIGKGYPIEPSKLILNMPLAFGYTLLMYSAIILVFILLLWGLLMLALYLLPEPCKAILFEVNSSYRAEVLQRFAEANSPYKNEATHISLNIQKSLSDLDNLKKDIKNANNTLCDQRQVIEENKLILQESESLIEATKREHFKTVNNCIDHFLSQADHRDMYIKKLRNFLMEPFNRDFEGFSGIAPTPETLMMIKASELKASKPFRDWVDEDN